MLIDPPVKMANSKGLPFSSLPGFQVTLDASNCGAAGTKNNPKLSSGAVAGMEKSGRRTTAGDGPLAGPTEHDLEPAWADLDRVQLARRGGVRPRFEQERPARGGGNANGV